MVSQTVIRFTKSHNIDKMKQELEEYKKKIDEKYYTARELAAILGIHHSVLLKYIKKK